MLRSLRWSAIAPRYRLAVALGIGQVVALLLCVPAYRILGWSIVWAGGPRFLPLVAAGIVVWAWTRRRTATDAGLAWALFMSGSILVALWQYAGIALNRPLIDETLARADAFLGISVKAVTAWTAETTWFLAILRFAYQSFLAQIFGVIILLAIRRDREAIWSFLLQYHIAAFITLVIAALWPAASPYVYLSFDPLLNEDLVISQIAAIRNGSMHHFRFDEVTGLVSMPSFHVGAAWIVTWAVRRSRWLLAVFVPLNLVLTVSTLMLGEHYAVDVLGGLGLTAVSIAVSRRLLQAGERRERA